MPNSIRLYGEPGNLHNSTTVQFKPYLPVNYERYLDTYEPMVKNFRPETWLFDAPDQREYPVMRVVRALADGGVQQSARDGNVVGFLEAMSELRMDGLPSKESSMGFAVLDPEPDFTFTFTFVDTNTDVYAYVFAGTAAAVFALAFAVVAVAADTANSEKIALTPQMRPCVTVAQILGGPEFGHAVKAYLIEELTTLVRDEWQRLHEGGALTL